MNLAEIKAAVEKQVVTRPLELATYGVFAFADINWLVERVEELAEALEGTATDLREAADAWPTPNHYTEVADRARAVLARLEGE